MANVFFNPRFVASVWRADDIPLPPMHIVAFAGKSNAGKSSLINALCNAKTAKVSRVPGKTRMINIFHIQSRLLADLPGYGYAKVPIVEARMWQPKMRDFLRAPQVCALVLIVDCRRGIGEMDGEMLQVCESVPEVIIALTKADKLRRPNPRRRTVKSHRNRPRQRKSNPGILPNRRQIATGIRTPLAQRRKRYSVMRLLLTNSQGCDVGAGYGRIPALLLRCRGRLDCGFCLRGVWRGDKFAAMIKILFFHLADAAAAIYKKPARKLAARAKNRASSAATFAPQLSALWHNHNRANPPAGAIGYEKYLSSVFCPAPLTLWRFWHYTMH